jgi:hypothetical protein
MIIDHTLVNILIRQVLISIYVVHIKLAAVSYMGVNYVF